MPGNDNRGIVGAAPILEIRDLVVELGGQRILDGLSLDVARGSIHALIGPNGAGKTTLIRSITGDMPHRGTITIRFRAEQRIGYVPQIMDFDRTLPITVGDFLTMMQCRRPVVLGCTKAVRERAREILDATDCAYLIDRLIGGLSGGELRRVLLAQAIAPMPELLLLDEPASNVDEYGARLFEQTIEELRTKHGVTVLMVVHDLSMIRRVADVATGINRTITFSGRPEELHDPDTLERVFAGRAEKRRRANGEARA